jgi:hypothetical protein
LNGSQWLDLAQLVQVSTRLTDESLLCLKDYFHRSESTKQTPHPIRSLKELVHISNQDHQPQGLMEILKDDMTPFLMLQSTLELQSELRKLQLPAISTNLAARNNDPPMKPAIFMYNIPEQNSWSSYTPIELDLSRSSAALQTNLVQLEPPHSMFKSPARHDGFGPNQEAQYRPYNETFELDAEPSLRPTIAMGARTLSRSSLSSFPNISPRASTRAKTSAIEELNDVSYYPPRPRRMTSDVSVENNALEGMYGSEAKSSTSGSAGVSEKSHRCLVATKLELDYTALISTYWTAEISNMSPVMSCSHCHCFVPQQQMIVHKNLPTSWTVTQRFLARCHVSTQIGAMAHYLCALCPETQRLYTRRNDLWAHLEDHTAQELEMDGDFEDRRI